MRIKLILLLLVCFLISGLTVPAISCPPPDCDDCETWNTETEVCESDCSTGQCCEDDGCVDDCSSGKCCNNGDCVSSCPTGKCCDDGDCVSSCPSSKCCDDGDCVDNCPTGECCDDGDCEPMEMDYVTSDKNSACVECEITFTATTDPTGYEDDVEWSGGGEPSTGSGATFTTYWDTSGTKTVTAELCDSEESKQVTIVKVDKVVESGTTDEGPLDTCIDESVGLEAIASPSGSFPTDEPHWSFDSKPAGSSPTLTPSTGSTTTLSNIDKAGNYVIRAKCGDHDTGDSITVIADGWKDEPAISGAAIKKSHDQTWFHITQSCDLRAKGYDADTKCDTEYDDYIRLDLTQWSGSPYLTDTLGEQVKWEPTEPTSEDGHTITATIKDDPDEEDGINTDDEDETATKVLKAYEAAADLTVNWANSGGSGDDTTTLFETGPLSDSISANMNDSESMTIYASTLPANTTHTDNDFFQPQEPFVKGKWTLRLNPDDAPLDPPGKIKVTTDVDISGTLECSVDDADIDSVGLDVDIDVEAGIGPVSVTISPTIDTSGQNNEAQAAISWGYSSDMGVTRADPYSERLEKSSGDGNGTFQESFNFTPDSQDHIGVKAEIAEGLAKVGGKIECKAWHLMSFPDEHDYFDASASMSCTGTVTYYIDLPTVQNPAYWPAEEGY